MHTRVKICGITRHKDGLAAAAAGADAVGLVFADSPRRVAPEQARAIAGALPPFIKVVGLFVDAPAEAVRAVLGRVPLDLLQFHGREAPDYCRTFGRPYIKTIHMKDDVDAAGTAGRYSDAAGILFDAFDPRLAGGSGATFDWSRVPRDLAMPVILAGGLTPDNVAEAVRTVRPYAVDVSSGVESSKGIKDAAKVAAFIRNAVGASWEKGVAADERR
jgi:phosphoribosylanthranilate isomerase